MDQWQAWRDWFFTKETLTWMFSGIGVVVLVAFGRWLFGKLCSQQVETASTSNQQTITPHRLDFKIEEVRVAHRGGPGGITPALYTCIRVTNKGQRDRSMVDFQISEAGGPSWKLSERPFSVEDAPLNPPIKVPQDDAQFFCIRAESSVTYDELPSQVGRLKLKIQDHLDESYELWLTEGSTKPF